jgi:hypothetical protein
MHNSAHRSVVRSAVGAAFGALPAVANPGSTPLSASWNDTTLLHGKAARTPTVTQLTNMPIPIGLAKVAGRLRSGRTGVGMQGNTPSTGRQSLLAPLDRLLEFSTQFIDTLEPRPQRRQRAAR